MKAKLIRYENSDGEDDEDNKEFVYKDPEIIEPELPPEDKFFYDWT